MMSSKNFLVNYQNENDKNIKSDSINNEAENSKIELFLKENSSEESENNISLCLKSFITHIVELQSKKIT